jgi:hypothetical protein
VYWWLRCVLVAEVCIGGLGVYWWLGVYWRTGCVNRRVRL